MDQTFDLNLLRLLVALDDCRSVTRAAERLDMSQSGMSTALARLRRRFHDPLFVRTAHGMEPTVRAASMARAARQALEDVQARVLAQPVFDPATARVDFRLAMADVAEIVFLPRLLAHLGVVAPGVAVSSESLARDDLQLAMETGRVDLALGYFPDLARAGFYSQGLYSHTYACMLRPGHPALARSRKGMTLERYTSLSHAVVSAPARSDLLFEHFLARRRIERRVALRTPHHLSLPAIIEATDLVATVPLATASRYADEGLVQIAALPFAPPVFEVEQAWHVRTHDEARMRWLRGTIAQLFNRASDPWQAMEQTLYGELRPRARAGRRRGAADVMGRHPDAAAAHPSRIDSSTSSRKGKDR